jgi:serine/threonine-protein kinase
VKIADFGLPKARAAAGEFAAPELLGTGAAPEGDPRSDLYSLGRVFYFLLTGRSGREAMPLVQLRPDVPPSVAAIVHRLLATNPADRFASATELLSHLGAAHVPVVFSPEGMVNFDLPYPAYGHDTGYLTGRISPPAPRAADPSPWAEITATSQHAGDTVPLERDETPEPLPRKPKAPGHGEPVPLWMTATLLVGIVTLSLMGIGAVVRMLAQ